MAVVALTAAAALWTLAACSSGPSQPESSAEPTAGESPFDLTSANVETRPTIESVPEAVDALEASGFEPVQEGKLTVALVGISGPPTIFLAEDDAKTLLGSDADFASLIADGLGLEFAPENVAWADWPLGLESGKYDLVVSNVGVTEERKDLFDFATYRDAVMAFSVANDSEIESIEEPADVAGLDVIVASGTNQEAFLLDWFEQNEEAGLDPGKPVYFEDTAAGLLALTSGRADANIEPYSVAAFREATLGETRIVGSFNSAWPVDGQVGTATAKGNGLVEPVQIVLNHLIETGVYDEVLERWGQEDEAIEESLINPPGLPRP